MKFKGSLLSAALLSATSIQAGLAQAEGTWSDPQTGREYLLLEGLKTHEDTFRECIKQGYAVFDKRFVSEGELQALANSGMLDSLTWETLHAGTTREASLARVWGAAEYIVNTDDIGPYSASILLLNRRVDRPLSSTVESGAVDQPLANGVCMSVEDFWYRCSIEYKCTYTTASGEYSVRHFFADYGASENEAIRRIIATTQEPRWAITEATCALRTETQHCVRYLP